MEAKRAVSVRRGSTTINFRPRSTARFTRFTGSLTRNPPAEWDIKGLLPNNMATSESSIWSRPARSEEHTSELQSLMRISYAVFCLKKKTITTLKLLDEHKQSKTTILYLTTRPNNQNRI